MSPERAPEPPAVAAPSLLRLAGVHLELQGKAVLDVLELDVAPGEIHGLPGPNGSGKSSLAYAVMGCEGYRPDGGAIHFAGRRIDILPTHERARLGITLAWQEPARFEGLSIGDYLRVGAPATDVADLPGAGGARSAGVRQPGRGQGPQSTSASGAPGHCW